MINYPTSFNVYKKSAAAQFTLLKPRRDDDGCIHTRNGIDTRIRCWASRARV